jgi:hypothetical protein
VFECRLDDGDWAPCQSPKDYVSLADGDHTFAVRARDAVGNTDPTPASRAWTVVVPSPPPVDPPDPPPPVEEGDPGAAEADEPTASYLRGLLRAAARANRGKQLKRLARTGTLRFELPAGEPGRLIITVSLLSQDGKAALSLARWRARTSSAAGVLERRLGRSARRRLGRLWVAAVEFNATLVPDGGEPVHDRRVFLVRR